MILGLLLVLINCCKDDEDNVNQTNGKSTAVFNPDKTYGMVEDIDGNIYKTIKIGNQTWMAENLRTIHYRNGDPITNVKDKAQWINLSTGAYFNINNTNNIDTIATFGRLYNWFAVIDNRKLAPIGWHIPTNDEWSILGDYLGGASIASSKLKEIGIVHWLSPNVAENNSGFTALPAGYRSHSNGDYGYIGMYGYWWTTTSYTNSLDVYYRLIYNGNTILYEHLCPKTNGYSVRCIKN